MLGKEKTPQEFRKFGSVVQLESGAEISPYFLK